MDRTSRHIAPRLASGIKRTPATAGLPPHIKHALQMVAAARGESLSWIVEQTFYAHYGFPPPKYVGIRTADLDITAPPKIKFPRLKYSRRSA